MHFSPAFGTACLSGLPSPSVTSPAPGDDRMRWHILSVSLPWGSQPRLCWEPLIGSSSWEGAEEQGKRQRASQGEKSTLWWRGDNPASGQPGSSICNICSICILCNICNICIGILCIICILFSICSIWSICILCNICILSILLILCIICILFIICICCILCIIYILFIIYILCFLFILLIFFMLCILYFLCILCILISTLCMQDARSRCWLGNAGKSTAQEGSSPRDNCTQSLRNQNLPQGLCLWACSTPPSPFLPELSWFATEFKWMNDV